MIVVLAILLYLFGSLLTVVALKCAGWWDEYDDNDDNEAFIIALWPMFWTIVIIYQGGKHLIALADKIVAVICPNQKQ